MKLDEIASFKTQKNSRVKIGLRNEIHYTDDIKECFEDYGNINHTKDNNAYFDWESDDAIWELKTRFNKKNQYPDTIIGYDKIVYGLEQIKKGKNVFLLFAFTDVGLTYWELTPEKLKKMKVDVNGCYIRMNRKEHLHIPVKELEIISDKLPLRSDEYDNRKKQYDLNRKQKRC